MKRTIGKRTYFATVMCVAAGAFLVSGSRGKIEAVRSVKAQAFDPVAFCLSGGGIGLNPIIGTPNDDVINGTDGNDCIVGLGGNDIINGRGGNDFIFGGEGNDVIDG